MFPEQSHRLQEATTLEIDIMFKRVSPRMEFEISSRCTKTNRSKPNPNGFFLQLYLKPLIAPLGITYTQVVDENESAAMHRELFHLIDSIVYEDTGHALHWSHIHHNFEVPDPGILAKTMVLADFHRGQALGTFLSLTCPYTGLTPSLL